MSYALLYPWACSRAYNNEVSKLPKADPAPEKGISGGYVDDPIVSVPADAFATFSTVYNGRRYYLGVDTIAAKLGKDTVMYYEGPNYATMWIAGPLWSPTGAILSNKDYTRTVKSVWLSERVNRERYLAKGTNMAGYSPLLLVEEDDPKLTMWHTAKDSREQSKYINGWMYDYSNESGLDVYRYLSFDPVYGFSRLYETRPDNSQRISVWDRKQGNDVTSTMTPPTYTFGLNTTEDTTRLSITSHVYYSSGVDRFRSRFDQMDIYVSRPTVYDDQYGLTQEPYEMFGYYEWASNPRPSQPSTPEALVAQKYNGHSFMPFYTVTGFDNHDEPENPEAWTYTMGWVDSTVMWVSDTKYSLNTEENLWHDTVFAIGTSPFNVLRKPAGGGEPTAGDYAPHSDWLRQHFWIKNTSGVYEHFVDSILLVRRTFHSEPFTTLSTSSFPNDWVFPYGGATTKTFDISATYESGSDIHYANHETAERVVGEARTLDLTTRSCYRDTIWTDDPTPTVDHIILYDTLLVEALLLDGTSAIGSGENQWITSVSLTAKNQIQVTVKAATEENLDNRLAQIRYTYRYRHSSAEGDWAESTRSIWIQQLGYGSTSAEIYSFSHKGGGSDLQPVHEKKQTFYAIPEENLQLLLHRDHWGYYRWFIYDEDKREKDLLYGDTWTWNDQPTNALGQNFMEINNTSDASSRGRWEVMKDVANPTNDKYATDHFRTDRSVPIPSISYPSSNSKSGQVACEVSAYYDIEPTGEVNKNLSAVVEPTLSYRQIIDIQPAKVQAEKMSHCRVNGTVGTDDKWMEEHTVIVPAGKAFSLQQQYPVSDDGDVVERDHLQYIYYFNPTGTNDANMGTKRDGVADSKSNCYARVGRQYEEGKTKRRAKLLTLADIQAMDNNSKKTILIASAYKYSSSSSYGSGYLLGENGNEDPAYAGYADSVTTIAKLTHFIEDGYLNPSVQSNYTMSLKKISHDANSATIQIYKQSESYPLMYFWGYHNSLIPGQNVAWIRGDESDVSGTKNITVQINAVSDNRRITGNDNAMMSMYMSFRFGVSYSGYLSACETNIRGRYSNNFEVNGDGSDANRAWFFFEIEEPVNIYHFETPRWEKSTDGTTWSTEVARKGTNNANYRWLDDGNLRISATTHTTANETIYYRLRTEHFQLAKFTVVTRNAAEEGPSTSAILTEDNIQNNYDILYTLGNENFPAPGTSDVKAHYHTLPWAITELSYHYPVGTDADKGEIPSSKRVFATDLPAAGEYAYLNKFSKDGHTTTAMAGAENGYMLCIHAAKKPVTIFNFTYPQLPCTDQDIYLTFNLCNPLDNGYLPQVTAELQGKIGEGDWVPISRFKTGELDYESGQWQQFVLPLDRSKIADKDAFRCVATLTGSTLDDAYILIDRMRFIAKERPVSVFQNKDACLVNEAGGDVGIIARLDYRNAGYPAGTLIAYQYQKKDGDTYKPLSTNAEASPAEGDIASYVNDVSATPATDINGKSCGVISIPAPSYVPCNGTTPCDSIVDAGQVATRSKCYVNEGPDAEHAYYVMYLSQEVHALVGDTFRVVMAIIPNKDAHPNFSTAGCASERIISINNPVELHVSGYDGVWPNYTRSELNGSDEAHNLREPNAAYAVTATINDAFLPDGKRPGSGSCMFDVVHTLSDDQGFGADEWFENRFGCSRAYFREVMTIFRTDVPENTMRLETNWNNIRPEDFMYEGHSKAQADSMYTTLNRLIVDSAFIEIGLSSYDIYMASNNNSYNVLWPIPASGHYIDATTSETRSVPVCRTPRWFEIHSNQADFSLRFGWDNMFAGNYYIVPIVRASATDANSSLPVRVSAITHDGSNVAVLGWDATTIIETNEPSWNNAVHTKTFRYRQDKDVRGETPPVAVSDYYYAGGTTGKTDTIVTFTPAPGNDYTLKAGYWYRFRAPYYRATVGSTFTEATGSVGYAEFILAIAPDTVRWTPSYAGKANYWNDDHNWAPVMANPPADGFKATVPMGDTKVIITEVAEGMLPIVSDVVKDQLDTLHYGYKKNTCRKILFKPRSQILGQEKLAYETAYIDVALTTGNWQTFSAAINDVYSGDMYIPYATTYDPGTPGSGASIDNEDFAPNPFPYTNYSGSYNPRVYPFALYQGFYNASVPVPFYNTDEDGTPVNNGTKQQSKNSVDWVKTPSLEMHYAPGSACVLVGYDETDADGNEIIVRLPKPDDSYNGYGKYGGVYISGPAININRPNKMTRNLAYDKTALGDADGISYTLHNETPSEIFFFGNPTMSLIDVYKLCVDNESVLKHEGGTYHFTAYKLIDGTTSTYTVKTIDGPGQFFIAPERAVGLIAATEATSLTIKLKPSAMVAITGEGTVVSGEGIASAPQRRIANHQSLITNKKHLYITASNETDMGVKKSYLTLGEQMGASRGYVYGEDALCISSGLNYYSDESFATPLSMYTIADNHALMQDIRDSLGLVPLVFTTLPDYSYSDYTFLSFYTDGEWDRAIYLYDAVTGDSLSIHNGLEVAVRTPQSDQMRYFINGNSQITSGENQQGVTTGIDIVEDENSQPQITNDKSQTTIVYDLLGRKVAVLGENELLARINLPTGVYVITRGNKAERVVIR